MGAAKSVENSINSTLQTHDLTGEKQVNAWNKLSKIHGRQVPQWL